VLRLGRVARLERAHDKTDLVLVVLVHDTGTRTVITHVEVSQRAERPGLSRNALRIELHQRESRVALLRQCLRGEPSRKPDRISISIARIEHARGCTAAVKRLQALI